MRSVVIPSAVAFATANRLHRVGALASPSSDLHYLVHPWVIGSQRLRETGWRPRWTNEAALARAPAPARRPGRTRPGRRGPQGRHQGCRRCGRGRGATLAVIGSLALARARRRR